VTQLKTTLPFVLGLWLVPCPSRSSAERPQPAEQVTPAESSPAAGPTRPATPPVPAHVYTNDDLERVRPFRDETGARSVPALPPGAGEAAGARPRRGSSEPADRGEAYWRREAEKVRERVRRLEDERDMLRARLAERRDDARSVRRRSRSARSSGTESDRALETRIAIIERRMRELEDDLAERARRAGALPGWLR
jgi:hypothetical protein